MLFEAENQFFIALSFIWLGLISTIFYDFFSIKTKNKIINSLFDFLFFLIIIFVYFYWITTFTFANPRFYYIISFFIGFLLEKIFLFSLIAKYKKMIYTIFNKKFLKYKEKQKRRKENRSLLQKKRIERKKENLLKKNKIRQQKLKNNNYKTKKNYSKKQHKKIVNIGEK